MPETFKTLLLRNCSLHSARRKVITTCPLLVRCKHDTSELFTFDSRKARNTSAAGRRTCGVKKAVNGRLGNAFSSGTGTVTLLTFFSETTAEKDGLTTGETGFSAPPTTATTSSCEGTQTCASWEEIFPAFVALVAIVVEHVLPAWDHVEIAYFTKRNLERASPLKKPKKPQIFFTTKNLMA